MTKTKLPSHKGMMNTKSMQREPKMRIAKAMPKTMKSNHKRYA